MSLSTEANRLRRAVDDGESFRDPAASLARQELGPLVLAGWCVAGGTEDHWLAASSAMRKALDRTPACRLPMPLCCFRRTRATRWC